MSGVRPNRVHLLTGLAGFGPMAATGRSGHVEVWLLVGLIVAFFISLPRGRSRAERPSDPDDSSKG
jgi:hypothetical protein